MELELARVRSAAGARERADAGPRAGHPPRARARPHRRRGARDDRRRRAQGQAGPPEPAVQRREVHAGGRPDRRAARRRATATSRSRSPTPGIGIAPEDQEAIFEEFRQVGHDRAQARGHRAGPALARKFVELHGGRLWVKSEVGRDRRSRSRFRRGPMPGELILLVEDNDNNRMLVRDVLQVSGYRVSRRRTRRTVCAWPRNSSRP